MKISAVVLFGISNNIYQKFSNFLSTLSAVSDGMHYAWTAPNIPILQGPNSHIKITQTDILWLENVYMIGSFVGIPFIIFTIDRFGRKAFVLIGTVQDMIAWVLIAFAPSVEYIYIARFLSGIAGNVAFSVAPMYISETSDKRVRGFLGSLIYLMMLVGILIEYSVAPFVSIGISSAVGFLFLLVQLVSFPFMPESPYYYILKNNREAARESLQKFRLNQNGINIELSERRGFADFITMKNSRRAMLIVSVLCLAQHFSSYSVIVMNLHSILDDVGASISSNNAAIIASALMLAAASLSSVLIDKAGRRVLLINSSIMTGITLLMLAVYFLLKHCSFNVELFKWVPVASIMLYSVVFKYGLGLVPIVIAAELFPTSVKAVGMAVMDGLYVISCLMSIYMYQALKDWYGIHVPFFIFGACCFLTAIFTVMFVPETKGKTLEEIQANLSRGLMTNADNNEVKRNKQDISNIQLKEVEYRFNNNDA
ncbi:hypothetical protein RI129_006510 [Pyrocoelia pectoralis]|uniref:Major facilitator superfamily (MFS) profile domain-containing protein n=1 Tax=Pyrocoelia pectoralis TaxID=417401 RepID=A0AAN7VBD8_9COLE